MNIENKKANHHSLSYWFPRLRLRAKIGTQEIKLRKTRYGDNLSTLSASKLILDLLTEDAVGRSRVVGGRVVGIVGVGEVYRKAETVGVPTIDEDTGKTLKICENLSVVMKTISISIKKYLLVKLNESIWWWSFEWSLQFRRYKNFDRISPFFNLSKNYNCGIIKKVFVGTLIWYNHSAAMSHFLWFSYKLRMIL